MVALSLFEVKEGGGGPIYKSKTNITTMMKTLWTKIY